MKHLNTWQCALMIAGLFCVLASYAWGRYSYTPKAPPEKIGWSNQNAEQLASIYGLSPEEVGKPVTLWGEKP